MGLEADVKTLASQSFLISAFKKMCEVHCSGSFRYVSSSSFGC